MRVVRVALLVAATFALYGCDVFPKDEAALGQQFIDETREGHLDAVQRGLDPALKSQKTDEALQRLSAWFPRESPERVRVVYWNTSWHSDLATRSRVTIYDFWYEYDFSHARALVLVRLKKTGTELYIETLHAFPLTKTFEQRNAFTLSGKSAFEYAFLALALLIPAFSIATLIACIRARIPKRKWLWALFVSLGFIKIELNWVTGQVGFQLLSLLLFGGGYTQQLYGPMIIQIAVPIGAILFWLGREPWYPPASDSGFSGENSSTGANTQPG